MQFGLKKGLLKRFFEIALRARGMVFGAKSKPALSLARILKRRRELRRRMKFQV